MKNNILLLLIVVSFGILSCTTSKTVTVQSKPLPSVISTIPADDWLQSDFDTYDVEKMKENVTYFFNTEAFEITVSTSTSTDIKYEGGDLLKDKNGLKMTVPIFNKNKIDKVKSVKGKVVEISISPDQDHPNETAVFAISTNPRDGRYFLKLENQVVSTCWLKVNKRDMGGVLDIKAKGWIAPQ